jgi:predicted MFS family arabinose efflux permease
MTKQKSRLILASVMLISLLGTAGIALPYPVLAPYFLDSPLNDLTHFMGIHPKILLGISLAIYPLGLLFGSLFIGALSDHYGRRFVLLTTLVGSVIGYILTAIAIVYTSFPGFILARFLTGVCEGNISVARAIAAELHPHIDRAKAISMVYTSTYTGWLIGPLMGGYLMVFGVPHVFAFAAVALALAWVLVFFAIADDKKDTDQQHSFWLLIRQQNSMTLFKHKQLRPLIYFYFLYSLGLNAFYDFYPVWFVDEYQASSTTIANATVMLTVAMITISSLVIARLNNVYGEIKLMISGSFVLALLLAIQPFLNLFQTSIIFVFIGASIAIANSMIPTYLSKYFGHLGEGKVMGLQVTIFCITNVIIAVIGGPLTILNSKLVLLLGSALIASSCFWMLYSKKSQEQMIVAIKS